MPSRTRLTVKNVAKTHSAPKVADEEMVIVQDVPALVEKLKAQADLQMLAMVVAVHRHAV